MFLSCVRASDAQECPLSTARAPGGSRTAMATVSTAQPVLVQDPQQGARRHKPSATGLMWTLHFFTSFQLYFFTFFDTCAISGKFEPWRPPLNAQCALGAARATRPIRAKQGTFGPHEPKLQPNALRRAGAFQIRRDGGNDANFQVGSQIPPSPGSFLGRFRRAFKSLPLSVSRRANTSLSSSVCLGKLSAKIDLALSFVCLG